MARKLSRPKAGFQSVPPRVDFLMLVSDTRHAKRKSGRSGGSGLFPAIKTALVDVCHEIRMCDTTILHGYGELGLGRTRKDAIRTNVLSQNSNSTEFSVVFTEPRMTKYLMKLPLVSMKMKLTLQMKKINMETYQ